MSMSSFFRNIRLWIFPSLVIASIAGSGCSFFKTSGGDGSKAGGFKNDTTATTSDDPMEVEIASDISQLDKKNQDDTADPNGTAGAAAGELQEDGTRVDPATGLVYDQNGNVVGKKDKDGKVVFDEDYKKKLEEEKKKKGKKGAGEEDDDDSSPYHGKYITYTVTKEDTLMKISYKAFANPLKWRVIYKDNKKVIKNPQALVRGTKLRLRVSHFPKIRKNGEPYYIVWADSLSKIAKTVYGDLSEWPKIFKNNPQLIRNPNKIYAGFTLYYVNGRKVAGSSGGVNSQEKSMQSMPEALPSEVEKEGPK